MPSKKKKHQNYSKIEIDKAPVKELRNSRRMCTLLKSYGLCIKKITGDGNCLFRAFADQIHGDQEKHIEERIKSMEFLKASRSQFELFIENNENFNHYIRRMSRLFVWGGHLELHLLSLIHKVNVLVYQLEEPSYIISNFPDEVECVQLSYHNIAHYNSVRLITDDINSAPKKLSLLELRKMNSNLFYNNQSTLLLDKIDQKNEFQESHFYPLDNLENLQIKTNTSISYVTEKNSTNFLSEQLFSHDNSVENTKIFSNITDNEKSLKIINDAKQNHLSQDNSQDEFKLKDLQFSDNTKKWENTLRPSLENLKTISNIELKEETLIQEDKNISRNNRKKEIKRKKAEELKQNRLKKEWLKNEKNKLKSEQKYLLEDNYKIPKSTTITTFSEESINEELPNNTLNLEVLFSKVVRI